jgi:aldose 1-epimerase
MAITLDAFGWRAVILPALGGAMASLHFEGEPVLRSAGPDVGDILDCASFPLVPFANRIGNGLLRIGERVVQLEREPVALPHAHHGHGWRRDWQVADVSDRHLILFYDNPGQGASGDGGWPWSYRAEQRFVIHPGGIHIDMAIVNRDPQSAMPCGTGFHPYFVRRRASAITLRATSIWANHPDGLAKALEPTDMFQGTQPVLVDALEELDNFFPCAEPVTIWGGDHPVVIHGTAMVGVHVYVPAKEDYFCVEPVSHPPDAFGRGEYTAADIVAPGATYHRRWDISLAAGLRELDNIGDAQK